MQDERLRILDVEKPTILFVTHDIEEALYLSDLVVLLYSSAPYGDHGAVSR
jgi:NitT/TauT family transport system ATP-binding protein